MNLSKYPSPGQIRFLKKTSFIPNSTSYNWIDGLLDYKDRTLKEWFKLIKDYKTPVFPVSSFSISLNLPKPPYIFPNVPDPFFHRDVIAKTLKELLNENLRLRWIVRKCIKKWKMRIYPKRIVGTVDLESMCEIPENWKISVHDPKTNRLYVFHTNTLQKTFVTALLNQSYAIASPQVPKNPYTNIPWSLGQIIHIIGQIHSRMMENCHSFGNMWIIRYRTVKYCLNDFEKRYNKPLQVLAASTFFGEPSNLFYTELFNETIYDIFDDMGFPTNSLSYKMILDRVLKPDLMKEWDTIVVNSFIHTNHNFFSSSNLFKSKRDFELYIASIYQKTIVFVNATKQALSIRSGSRTILSSV